MFTGIIEAVGTVKSIEKKGLFGRIVVECALDLSGIRVGDSIAVNGSCLTVTELSSGSFSADISAENFRGTTLAGLSSDGFTVAVIPHTLRRTTLPDKREGARVNIETDVIGKYVEKHLASG